MGAVVPACYEGAVTAADCERCWDVHCRCPDKGCAGAFAAELREHAAMTAPMWRGDGMLLAFDNGLRVTADGATPLAAAVVLAEKLGLL